MSMDFPSHGMGWVVSIISTLLILDWWSSLVIIPRTSRVLISSWTVTSVVVTWPEADQTSQLAMPTITVRMMVAITTSSMVRPASRDERVFTILGLLEEGVLVRQGAHPGVA